jgi:hypothetical protein
MAYLACSNCKFVWFVWNENDREHGQAVFHDNIVRQAQQSGIQCPECFSEMKIILGHAPETCHHGRPLNMFCRECKLKEQTVSKTNGVRF